MNDIPQTDQNIDDVLLQWNIYKEQGVIDGLADDAEDIYESMVPAQDEEQDPDIDWM